MWNRNRIVLIQFGSHLILIVEYLMSKFYLEFIIFSKLSSITIN